MYRSTPDAMEINAKIRDREIPQPGYHRGKRQRPRDSRRDPPVLSNPRRALDIVITSAGGTF